jgi:leader peptidase (prepilin peptidase)/N-methyltransferase
MIRILGTIFAGLLGLAFGSFLNVCLSRWPVGESVVSPRSHCRQCSRALVWWENVPLVSWLALRGRCRTCRAWIGWRYPLVELAVGALWAIYAWRLLSGPWDPDSTASDFFFGFLLVAGQVTFYWLLLALAILDAENLWLPNWITLPGIALGLAFKLLDLALIVHQHVADDFETERYGPYGVAAKWLLGILAAAGFILLIRWLYWLVRRREGIGLGDAKLMALLAAWLGLPGALLAFGLGVVLGALAAVVLLVVPSARRDSETWAFSKLPLGTFLCIGGIVTSLWGQPIIAAYLRWAGF